MRENTVWAVRVKVADVVVCLVEGEALLGVPVVASGEVGCVDRGGGGVVVR